MSTLSPSDALRGLDRDAVEAAQRAGLTNRSSADASRTFGQILRGNLVTRFNLLLAGLAIVALIVGPGRDATFVGVVAANAAISVIQEWRASRALGRLRLLNAPRITVMRSGAPVELPSEEIVVGDIVRLDRGDQVPVDGEVLVSDGLEIDTSLLTGESEPELASVGDTVQAGTIVVAGSGVVRADGVGDQRLASRIEAEARRFDLAPSDLLATTDRLLRIITWVIVVLGPLLALRQALGPESWREGARGTVAGMVSMVPEGLVLLTSASLTIGALRLGRRRVLTQELPAIELLARVDTLCLDKTGTITTGQPRMSDVVLVDPTETDADAASLDQLHGALAALARTDPNPNLTLAAILAAHPVDPGWVTTDVVAFSSARRWGGATFRDHGSWVLGAPDVLRPGVALPEAGAGHRVVSLGRTDGALSHDSIPAVTVIGYVLLAEQVRPTAPATLAYLRDQDIRIKVFSGDHPGTVADVVRSAGVDVRGATDGRLLPSEPDQLARLVDENDVLGRVEPHGKQQLVRALKSQGHVVGMTGDGVNDVLALKEADLGIAMGSGSAAARAVSEFVLLDDNFDVMPDIVDEGRRVLANVERVSVFFLTKTVWACALTLLVVVSGMPYPLFASQATLIGFVAIGVPAFLLSFRKRAPRSRTGIFNRVVWRSVPFGITSAIAGASVFAIVHYSLHRSTSEARSATTLTITAVSLGIVACNLGEAPGRWRLLPPGLLALGTLAVVVPVARHWFSLVPQTRGGSLTIGAAALIGWATVALVDTAARRVTRRRSTSR
jgi:magnesium-transporting ATPase (P-type)